jgi:hypothetical protein
VRNASHRFRPNMRGLQTSLNGILPRFNQKKQASREAWHFQQNVAVCVGSRWRR